MKPINLKWRCTTLMWLSLMLVTSFTDLSGQCDVTAAPPDATVSATGLDCEADYTVGMAEATPNPGPTCTTFVTAVNGVDLMPPMPTGAIITLDAGENILDFAVAADAASAAGNSDGIFFVTVLPADTGIACNDGVQVSLGSGCNAIITPDMVLEGSYCFDAYTVSLEDAAGNVTMHDDAIGGAEIFAPGEYTVSVTDPSGNSCWSTITAEDKIVPNVTCCDDIQVPCFQTDFRPGAPSDFQINTAPEVTASVQVATSDTIPVVVTSFSDANVALDIDLDISIVTTDVASITIELVSPDGNSAVIADFSGVMNCTASDIDVSFDDSAFIAFDVTDCGQSVGAAFAGDYRSMSNALSSLGGSAVDGEWSLIVSNTSTEDEADVTATLHIEEQTDMICFPIIEKFDQDGNLITPIFTLIDDQEYEVTFPGNACSSVFAFYVDTPTGEDCTGTFLSGFDRTWTFSSNSDFSQSTSCTHTITQLQLDIDDVNLPPDFDGIDLPAFECSEVLSDPNLLDPMTGIVGFPYHAGNESLCSNFNVTYEDMTLPLCGASFKLIRKFTIIDWCTGDLEEHNQIIKVEDTVAPAVTAPVDDQVVSTTSQHDCVADVFVDPLGNGPNGYGFNVLAAFDCSDFDVTAVEFLLGVPGQDFPQDVTNFQSATNLGNGEYLLPELNQGFNWVRYEFTDDCGNISEARFEIIVEDTNPPNPVCLEFTIAALGQDGCAKVRAESFDNGSFDNCGVVDFRARIFNSGSSFDEKLDFCCTNYTCNDSEMIELAIFDAEIPDGTDVSSNFGNLADGVNYSICMVEVGFQDKIDPVILDGPSSVNVACDVVIESLADLGNYLDLNSFDVSDNCASVSPQLINGNFPISGNQCGGGSASFTWRVEDDCGNNVSHSATVSFGEASPIGQIVWPFDGGKIESFGCPEFGPDNPISPEEVQQLAGTGVVTPQVIEGSCNTSAFSFEDQFFPDVNDDGVCMKIVRTWTVIDWCTFDENTNSGVFTNSQIITFIDDTAPVIFTPGAVNCETDVLYNSDENECQPFVKILLDASDDCDSLTWDITVVDCGGQFGSQSFSGSDISGFYSHGEIEVTATATDLCGNATTEVFTMTIPDCKPPTPYCLGEIVTVTLPDNLTTEIWANDFEFGSFDDFASVNNCSQCPAAGSDPLEFFFLDDNGNFVPVLELTCADIPGGIEAVISLDVWVVDPNGAPGFDRDFCTVELILQDNINDICPDSTDGENSRVAGTVHMYDDRPMSGSNVVISSNQPEFPRTDVTGLDGSYEFGGLPTGIAYEVESNNNTAILNGVSTLDILLIQRHLLSLTPFTSPYQYIAADANNSENVTAADMVAIRNVILERTSDYVNGQESWRFVDETFTFNDPTSPFPYGESIDFILNNDMNNQDFIAVKIGDINNDAQAAFDGKTQAEFRGQPLNMTIESNNYTEGEEVRVDVTSNNFNDILGMQFTLNYDETLAFDRFETGVLDLTNDYAGLSYSEEGKVAVSWNTSAPVNAAKEDVLFTIVYHALANGTTSHILVDNSITADEAYNNNLDVMEIIMTNENGQASLAGYDLHQNRPNPFSGKTLISFTLPTSQKATLAIYDMSGRTLETFSGVFGKGLNEINVEASDWSNSTGVFYYQLNTEGYTATKKMILTD